MPQREAVLRGLQRHECLVDRPEPGRRLAVGEDELRIGVSGGELRSEECGYVGDALGLLAWRLWP
jgi:hypothetical protein